MLSRMNWTPLAVAFFLIIAMVSGDGDGNGDGEEESFVNPFLPQGGIQPQSDIDFTLLFKCLENADADQYGRVQLAKNEATECIRSLVNITQVKAEVEAAKPTGDLDVVFRKYCRLTPNLRHCTANFSSSLEPCLNQTEIGRKQIVENVTSALLSFVCHKEGDRIALFITEGGPECLMANLEGVKQCLDQTLLTHNSRPEQVVSQFPAPFISAQECKDIRDLQKCILTKLETCDQPTPSNIIESMFNSMYKATPCPRLPVPTDVLENQTEVPNVVEPSSDATIDVIEV